MIVQLEITDLSVAEQVRALQQASYKVEADLIGFDQIPPLLETVSELQTCGEAFYGCLLDGNIVGAISYRCESDVVDIHRMIVHPSCFRQGVAGRLLDFLMQRYGGSCNFVVATGAQNVPAVRLYEKHGFVRTGSVEVAPGVWVVQFCKSVA